MQATLTSKGQITIPKAVRDTLHLHTGDRLEFMIEKDGSIRIIPAVSSVTELKGLVPPPHRTLSLEEMDEAIAKGATDT